MSLVEYHDPDDLFPLLSPGLFARLPLRNLHWKSPSRPLRSISSLHVEFLPDQQTRERQSSGSGVKSFDNDSDLRRSTQKSSSDSNNPAKAADGALKAPPKGRRHQIPGLRQTPYLKIYLLKCDDSEAYKATSRKLLRDWLKDNVRETEGVTSKSKQEKHDAFEWLVIHIVLPDTPAAGQPRWSRTSGHEATEPKEKSTLAPKWPGRSSSTILEKIRSDFNQNTKNAPDRVAQIRLQKTSAQQDSQDLSTSSVGSAYAESPQESAQAWSDLINKFKALILMSFDLRVHQYAEDLREKDAQRVLPGWNFCTFFVLKEGLARAFESVGLFEDALIGYDELSAGLDVVIRDQAGDAAETASFKPFTKDLYDELVARTNLMQNKLPAASVEQSRSEELLIDSPISSSRKDYRTLILSNNISIFDFQCYIFSRQMFLLLRLANVRRSQTLVSDHSRASVSELYIKSLDPGDGIDSNEDTISLAELCKRAPIFITAACRIMRQDLRNGASLESVELTPEVMDMFVYSWAFSVAQQTLEATLSKSLYSERVQISPGGSQGAYRPDLHSVNRSAPPTRQHTYPLASGQVIYENERFSQSQDIPKAVKQTAKAALGEAAGYRGDLILLQRNALQKIARYYGWQIHSDGVPNWDERVPLTDEGAQSVLASFFPVKDRQLREYLASFEDFEKAYSHLTSHAIQQYTIAGRKQSANTLYTEIAILKYEDGDFATAANHFQSVLSVYSEERWNLKEYSVLQKYAHCLKELHRKDEYVRIVLTMLAKLAAKERSLHSMTKPPGHQIELERPSSLRNWSNDANVEGTNCLSELITYSEQLPYDMAVSMSKYFDEIDIDSCLIHYDDQDGFSLRVSFRPLIREKQVIEKLRLRLVDSETGENREIWLENTNGIPIEDKLIESSVSSNVTTSGEYKIDKLTLQLGKLIFVHEISSKVDCKKSLTTTTAKSDTSSAIRMPNVLVYPRIGAFEIDIAMSSHVHIGKPRSVILNLASRDNHMERGKLQLRSASAGLRIRTAEAEVIDGKFIVEDQSKAGLITFGEVSRDSQGKLRIPYDLERSTSDIAIRVEFTYSTARSQYVLVKNALVNVELAIDVNVQEIFKNRAVISKFFVRPTRAVPCQLLNAQLDGSSFFEIEPIAPTFNNLLALPKQPACVAYKISRVPDAQKNVAEDGGLDTTLTLTVDYRSVPDDVGCQLAAKFSADLDNSPFHSYGRLLVPELVRRIRKQLPVGHYERAGLLGELMVPPSEALQWKDLVKCLSGKAEQGVGTWLQQWHKQNEIFQLTNPEKEGYAHLSPSNRLTIDFEVPRLQYLHTVSLHLQQPHGVVDGGPTILSVGEGLGVEIRISHTKRWDTSALRDNYGGQKSSNRRQQFAFELQANPEAWIVGGQRRERFYAAEDEEVVFEKVLIPVRTGYLLFPAVEVKAVAENAQEAGISDSVAVSCETDFVSHGEVVLVIENSRSVTSAFGQDGHISRGVTVLESEARATTIYGEAAK